MVESSSRNWGRRSQVRKTPKPNSCHNKASCVRDHLDDGATNPLWAMRGYTQVWQKRKTFLDAKNTTTKNKTRVSSGFVCSCLQQVFHGWKENKRAGCVPLKVKIISGLKSNSFSCLWILRKHFQSDFHNQLNVLASGPPHLSDPSMVAYRQGYLGN